MLLSEAGKRRLLVRIAIITVHIVTGSGDKDVLHVLVMPVSFQRLVWCTNNIDLGLSLAKCQSAPVSTCQKSVELYLPTNLARVVIVSSNHASVERSNISKFCGYVQPKGCKKQTVWLVYTAFNSVA